MGILSPFSDTNIIFKNNRQSKLRITAAHLQTGKHKHTDSQINTHSCATTTNTHTQQQNPQTVRIKSTLYYSNALGDQYLFSFYAFISVFNFTGQ